MTNPHAPSVKTISSQLKHHPIPPAGEVPGDVGVGAADAAAAAFEAPFINHIDVVFFPDIDLRWAKYRARLSVGFLAFHAD